MTKRNFIWMSPSPEQENANGTLQRRLLVVDDEPTLRLGFSYALSNRSTQVDTASTGRQALEKLKSTSYDILILDLRMPDIDGLGVIEMLRQAGNPIPIVLCSAALTPVAVLRAIKQQVPDFLLKPVRPVDLREIVDYVLAPPDSPISKVVSAVRAGNIPAALEQAGSDSTHDHGVAIWLKVLGSILNPPEEESSAAGEQLIRSSLAALAFRAPNSPSS
ncbi:MAG: response regulator [Verrucomicrobiaceae bacterium]|nr:MAG: response regulator [Verrucomicrobiaceae bacterium]